MKTRKAQLGLVWLLLCMGASQFSSAQQNKEISRPQWITMMYDPNVNYFQAVDAFNAYWKNREKPVEEGELFESATDQQKQTAIRQKKERLKDNDPARLYAFEYKRFLWWMREMEPFVQPDGRIKDMDQRIQEWSTQQQQKKTQEQQRPDAGNKPGN